MRRGNDLCIETRPFLLESHTVLHHAGDQKYGVTAEEGGVCDGSLQSGQTFRSGISFGARQRVTPVNAVDHAVNHDAGFLGGGFGFGPIQPAGTVHFDSGEAELLDQVELVLNRAVVPDHPVLDRHPQLRHLSLRGDSPWHRPSNRC